MGNMANMLYSLNKELDISDKIAIVDSSKNNLRYTTGSKDLKIVSSHCGYCGSGLLSTDQQCPFCGGPTINNKPAENLKPRDLFNVQSKSIEDGIIAISIEGDDFSLKKGERKRIIIWAIPQSGAPFLCPNWILTYTGTNEVAITEENGQPYIVGIQDGQAGLTVYLKNKPSVSAECKVFVEPKNNMIKRISNLWAV